MGKRRKDSWQNLRQEICTCEACPRLVKFRRQIARDKRAAYRDQDYWGKPVPGFGDPKARLLVVGLAPGAHGANRTGRVFTGDRSGDWLYGTLYETGFANQAESSHAGDGLRLKDCFISLAVRCAPPGNQPTPNERDSCRDFFQREVALLPHVEVIVALGAFAWQAVFRLVDPEGKRPTFSHGARVQVGPVLVLGSYHPSQQNTFTGRLTKPMFLNVFSDAREALSGAQRLPVDPARLAK